MKLRFLLLLILSISTIHLQAQLIRTIDGTGNNLVNPNWGSAGAELGTITSNGFENSIDAPAGTSRPNPRIISNVLFAQDTLFNDPLNLSDYVWVFGQFLDHDMTAVSNSPVETANIPVNFHDVHFNPGNMNDNVMIRMNRSMPRNGSGTSPTNPRLFTNDITSWIDGSNVYGSDQARADYLRSFSGGKLKTSAGDMLPYNTDNYEADGQNDSGAPHMENENPFNNLLFVAGDARANEQPLLVGFHTLFVREHNRLCDELAVTNPTWTDEQLYQHARKMIGGFLQSIVYNEWLPTIGVHLPAYSGYDPAVYPNATNVFSGAAFRLGHTLLNSNIQMMEDDGTHMGSVTLAQAFFNPQLVNDRGLDRFLKGMAQQVEQKMDGKVVDDVRNFLFGPPQLGLGGLDLAAININRGRERGLPDFNTIRTDMGLAPYTSFNDLCSDDPQVAMVLSSLYDINDVDAWVGMLVEDHMPDALFGETVMAVMIQQFQAVRDGDRFYYENDPGLSTAEKNEITSTTFRDIIMRNTNVSIMQSNVFAAMPHDSICVTTATTLPLFGSIQTHTGASVSNATIALTNSAEALLETATTDNSGNYTLANYTACQNYFLSPSLDGGDIREGLDSWDLVLMIRHILNLSTLDSPYKIIAGDVNNNGVLNVADVIDLQRLLLYYENNFTNNNSWRFVSGDYTFIDPANPFAAAFPENAFVKLSEHNMDQQFIALKTGDVSGNADPANLTAGDTRTDEVLTFIVPNTQVVTGETITVPFSTKDFKQLAGYQYTLNFDPTVLEFVNVETNGLENLTDKNFVVLNEEGAITTNWFNHTGVTSEDDATVFNISFRAKQNSELKEVLSLNSRYTNAIAYQNDGTAMNVALNFIQDNEILPANQLELYQNQPNPFKSETLIGFNLPETMDATLEFYDLTGRRLHRVSGEFGKGYNEVSVSRAALAASGIIYYQLETKGKTITKKMILH